MFGAICSCTYSLSYALPTMINLLGYSSANAQLLTIPVYAFGCILCVINSVISDRMQHRAAFIIIPMGITMVGLIIGMAADPTTLPGVIYFGFFLVAGGIFAGIPTTVAWVSNNLAGQWKRAVGMAVQFTIGNLVGGAVGSNIFLSSEKPKYISGYATLFAFITCSFLSGWVLLFLVKRWNAKRAVQMEDATKAGRDLDAECKDLGDKNPCFKYTL